MDPDRKMIIAILYDPFACSVLNARIELLKDRSVAAMAVCRELKIMNVLPPPPAMERYMDGCRLFGAPIMNITM